MSPLEEDAISIKKKENNIENGPSFRGNAL